MFELVANVLFVGVNALLFNLYPIAETKLPPLNEVAPIEMTAQLRAIIDFREKDTCVYSGLIVPFERTWEMVQVVGGVEIVTPSAPGEIEGQALILNKKQCEGQAPIAMLRYGTYENKGIFRRSALQPGLQFVTHPLAGLPEEQQPKWLKQVMTKIETAAQTNPKAREFVEFSTAAAKQVASTADNAKAVE